MMKGDKEGEVLAQALESLAADVRDGHIGGLICFALDKRPGKISFGAMTGNPLLIAGLVKQASLLNENEILREMENNLAPQYLKEQGIDTNAPTGAKPN